MCLLQRQRAADCCPVQSNRQAGKLRRSLNNGAKVDIILALALLWNSLESFDVKKLDRVWNI